MPFDVLAGLAAKLLPALLGALLAVASVSIGVVAERWLFFAEARHMVDPVLRARTRLTEPTH